MFGLDFRLLKLDLLLEHKRVTSIYVKYGQIRTCCLGTSSSQSGAFLLLDEQHKVELMRGDVEIEIMSKNSSIIGMGRATGCHLSDALVMATITSVPTFQYIGGALVDMQIVRSTPGKPDIILGTAQLSICMYQLLVRKTCNCEDFTKREEDRDVHFNPFPVYPDADSENTSLEEDGYSEPDGSLDNFLVRLYSRSTAQQTVPINEKWSTASQTQFSHVRASFSKKVLRVSKDFGVADVVAVVAPTHIAVPRQALVRTQPNQQSSSSSSSKGYRQRQLQQQEDGPAVDSYAFIDTPPARVTVVSVTQRPVNKRGNYSRPTNHHSTSARRSSVPAATNTNTMTGTTALTATHVGNRPASSQPQEKKRVGTAKKHIEPIPRHHKDTIRKPAWH